MFDFIIGKKVVLCSRTAGLVDQYINMLYDFGKLLSVSLRWMIESWGNVYSYGLKVHFVSLSSYVQEICNVVLNDMKMDAEHSDPVNFVVRNFSSNF